MTESTLVGVAVAASLSLNALFLKRLLSKLDAVYNVVVGTPERPGLVPRVIELEREFERFSGISLAPKVSVPPNAYRSPNMESKL